MVNKSSPYNSDQCIHIRLLDGEFDKWKRALEKTVNIEVGEEAWERLYKHISNLITYKTGKKIAARIISQFGEESTKVVMVD